MRPWLLLLLIAGLETAALACSCNSVPDSPDGIRRLARETTAGALAVAEVSLITPYDQRTGRGEQLRVRRVLAGRVPERIWVERMRRPAGPACDTEFHFGRRKLVILYPSQNRSPRLAPMVRVSNSCTVYLLGDPRFRAAVVAELRRRA